MKLTILLCLVIAGHVSSQAAKGGAKGPQRPDLPPPPVKGGPHTGPPGGRPYPPPPTKGGPSGPHPSPGGPLPPPVEGRPVGPPPPVEGRPVGPPPPVKGGPRPATKGFFDFPAPVGVVRPFGVPRPTIGRFNIPAPQTPLTYQSILPGQQEIILVQGGADGVQFIGDDLPLSRGSINVAPSRPIVPVPRPSIVPTSGVQVTGRVDSGLRYISTPPGSTQEIRVVTTNGGGDFGSVPSGLSGIGRNDGTVRFGSPIRPQLPAGVQVLSPGGETFQIIDEGLGGLGGGAYEILVPGGGQIGNRLNVPSTYGAAVTKTSPLAPRPGTTKSVFAQPGGIRFGNQPVIGTTGGVGVVPQPIRPALDRPLGLAGRNVIQLIDDGQGGQIAIVDDGQLDGGVIQDQGIAYLVPGPGQPQPQFITRPSFDKGGRTVGQIGSRFNVPLTYGAAGTKTGPLAPRPVTTKSVVPQPGGIRFGNQPIIETIGGVRAFPHAIGPAGGVGVLDRPLGLAGGNVIQLIDDGQGGQIAIIDDGQLDGGVIQDQGIVYVVPGPGQPQPQVITRPSYVPQPQVITRPSYVPRPQIISRPSYIPVPQVGPRPFVQRQPPVIQRPSVIFNPPVVSRTTTPPVTAAPFPAGGEHQIQQHDTLDDDSFDEQQHVTDTQGPLAHPNRVGTFFENDEESHLGQAHEETQQKKEEQKPVEVHQLRNVDDADDLHEEGSHQPKVAAYQVPFEFGERIRPSFFRS